MKSRLVHIGLLLLFQSCASQSRPNLTEGVYQAISTETFDYYLYFPDDYEIDKNEKFPLLLFLHGGGESGDSLVTIKKNGPPKLITEGKKFPFLILAPQNPHKRKWWNTKALMQLLDNVVSENRVDPDRIYLTGLSRGGGAAWELVVQYPEKFAALAVVCGMTPVPYAAWINKDLPIWVFHGEDDKSIPISESENMVERLKSMGYEVRFTKYPGVGHNAWEKAYATDELYEWFMKKKRD